MADNTILNAGSGGDTIATDDVGGIKYPRGKLSLGADGTANDAVGGAGAVSASVLRTTLASDDPAVVALQILDDWDEADRAKVNLIVGQAGVAAGAGAVGATVPRVTLGSDDPAVTSLQLIDDGVATAGSAITAKGLAAVGTDGTNARILKTDTSGELQVDVLTLPSVTVGAALPAGNNNIGDVDVASLPALPAGNNNIGDVDVLTLPALPAGNNNIGDVDVVTLPALPAGTNNIGDVDVVTQPARAATSDTITAKLATDKLQNGVTELTPKFAYLDATASGSTQIVAAVATKKLRVVRYSVSNDTAVNVYFRSATAGQISSTKRLAANSAHAGGFTPVGHFETTAGEALQVNLSGTANVGVDVVYVEV